MMETEKKQSSIKEKAHISMRSIMDVGMGILWAGMGIFLVFIDKSNTALANRFDDPVMKGFGGICILYGIFRVYRGIKKNYTVEK